MTKHGLPSAHVMSWIGREILPHEGEIRALLRHICWGEIEIDDVIQEAYARIATVSDPKVILAPRAYFLTTARNIVNEQLRRARVVKIETVAEFERLIIEDGEPSQEDVVSWRQQLNLVWAVIGAMPPRMRSVFILRKIERFSQKEISRKLAMSENAVEQLCARAMRMLARKLGEGVKSTDVAVERIENGIAGRSRSDSQSG